MKHLYTAVAVISLGVAGAVSTALPAHAATHQVTYKVWSEYGPSSVATIGYNAANGGREGAVNAQLPWSKDIQWTDDTKHPVININGFNTGEGNRIFCQILVDGQVVDEGNRVEGATCTYAIDGMARRHCKMSSRGQVIDGGNRVPGDPCDPSANDAPSGSG